MAHFFYLFTLAVKTVASGLVRLYAVMYSSDFSWRRNETAERSSLRCGAGSAFHVDGPSCVDRNGLSSSVERRGRYAYTAERRRRRRRLFVTADTCSSSKLNWVQL